MAYGLVNISPLDLQQSTAIGVKIPFDSPSVFTSVYTTKEQIKYNLINYLLTDRYERPFNPNFGAGLRSILFEQIYQENLDQIKSRITSQIEANFPVVKVESMEIISEIHSNSITIRFSYIIMNTKQSDSIGISIQNA